MHVICIYNSWREQVSARWNRLNRQVWCLIRKIHSADNCTRNFFPFPPGPEMISDHRLWHGFPAEFSCLIGSTFENSMGLAWTKARISQSVFLFSSKIGWGRISIDPTLDAWCVSLDWKARWNCGIVARWVELGHENKRRSKDKSGCWNVKLIDVDDRRQWEIELSQLTRWNEKRNKTFFTTN